MLGEIIGAVAGIGGAMIGSSANADAANAANQMTYEGMRISTDAINKYIDAIYSGLDMQSAAIQSGYTATVGSIEEGSQAAQATLGAMREEAEPGMRFLRNVIANPMRLTSDQKYQIDESRRINAQNIRSSGFAGSGRTAAALMNKVENDTTNSMLEKNRAAAMAAAGGLADSYDQSGRGIAGLQSSEGNAKAQAADTASARAGSMYDNYHSNLGNAYMSIGKTQAAGMQAMGNTTANAMTANGNLMGQAIGDIGSSIASASRAKTYADRMSKYESGAGLY
ncbi:hypothetical protein [Mesorhizobium onobrychidis]|uniref:Uncharacterized protein n=1 Tax=Mesorhizobium onobrychidis TaxID=2775404 RepID=A0ABY5QX96_9HYPH|nr:hypothetical protein [Mesorhizobium onobrychidis]UVC14697.1 hypothetical protein IHQ72_29460 [Mesorhizobium onobrychidis]